MKISIRLVEDYLKNIESRITDLNNTINLEDALYQKPDDSKVDMLQSLKCLKSTCQRELVILKHLENSPLDSIGLSLEEYDKKLDDVKIYLLSESEYENRYKTPSDKLGAIRKILEE